MLVKSTPMPPRGWNSYDSYGVYINEEQALANIEAFAEKLAPHGYEFFVLDACWYSDGTFMDTYKLRNENKDRPSFIDEWGRFIG
ncbi:MAG: glycoside hydrolase family 27 protein, partial [Lentisphaeria bacterium]|nr:glycoside hydrolase family 27 protein [Lentisphaeria bacterium]